MDTGCVASTRSDISQFTVHERGLLKRIGNEKLELETKRDQLQKELDEVKTNITKTQRRYGEIYNARSSIDTLPNEILISIFQEFHRENNHWRRLAILTFSFWHIFRYDGKTAPRIPLDRLQAYLDRSQTHSLDIYISFTDSGEGWTEQPDILEAIVPHLGQCRILQVLSDNDTQIDDFIHKVGHASLPLLEYLSICSDKFHDAPEDHTVSEWNVNTLLDGAAPSLKYLCLDATSIQDFRPPLSSIVHLHLEQRRRGGVSKLSFEVFDEVLALPQLETLSIWRDIFFLTGMEYAGASAI